MIADVEFPGVRGILRGRLYAHDAPRPVVVMTHGFSATAFGMAADTYAEVLHESGLAVLLFDHEGFGRSDGEPAVIDRWLQMRGYEHAIAFARGRSEVEASRVALWGDSFSGAVAIALAAFDPTIAALVVQVPACGTTTRHPEPGAFEALRGFWREVDPTASVVGEWQSVVAEDPDASSALLPSRSAYEWFTAYGGRPGSTWRATARMATQRGPVPFSIATVAPHIACPSLWVIAEDDDLPGVSPEISRDACAAARGEELLIDGGHFGLLYEGTELLTRVARAEAAFLVHALRA
jgi:alpha-beta hydrolase superfamily lysophospholipase